MIEQDTIRLLRECSSGVQMGTASIENVLDSVQSDSLKKSLSDCKDKHLVLDKKISELLNRYGDDEKSPGAMAKTMSKAKVAMKLAMNDSDETIADLMTEGCNMGVKTLSRYLNQYKAADEQSKSITKDLISLEETLTKDIRRFL
ncbi:MAG: hypothetical protein LUH08_00470 [Ruminococcus sp.]|nr:hypothetical protein [Ruminococcus sp.]